MDDRRMEVAYIQIPLRMQTKDQKEQKDFCDGAQSWWLPKDTHNIK